MTLSEKNDLRMAEIRISQAYREANLDDDGEHETAEMTVRRSDIVKVLAFLRKTLRKNRAKV